MTKVPIEEKKRIAAMLSHRDRPLQIIQDKQFPGLAARRRETELVSSTALERVFTFLARFGQAAGLH